MGNDTQVDTQVDIRSQEIISEKTAGLIERDTNVGFCTVLRSKMEIATYLGLKSVKSIKEQINHLLELEIIEMTIPEKPRSSRQRYIARSDTNGIK